MRSAEITPHKMDEKFCRLDIRAEVDGKELDIEIQIGERDDFRARLNLIHAETEEDIKKLETTGLSEKDINALKN